MVGLDAAHHALPAGVAGIDHRAQGGLVLAGKHVIEFVNAKLGCQSSMARYSAASLISTDDTHRGAKNETSPNVVLLPDSGSALVMLRIGLCVATSSWVQANMIHSVMASASSCEQTTCRRMRRMMSRSNKSPSTGSGQGSTFQ